MKKLLIAFFTLVTGLWSHAQDLSLYEKHWYVSGKDTLPYRVLLPEDYDKSEKYPLILFLHGAGERGNDNELQLVHGAKLFLDKDVRKEYPAIVVFPQCPSGSYWSNIEVNTDEHTGKRILSFPADADPTPAMKLLQDLVHQLMESYAVKKDQLYVGGLSMGGMGTFELVRRMPGIFAAAFPICGGGNPATVQQLLDVKWWVFHGQKDDVVPPALSEEMVNAMQGEGADVRFTLYPEANHNSWDPAFAEPELLSWLFSQKRKKS